MEETKHTVREYIERLRAADLLVGTAVPAEAAAREVAYISYDSQDIEPGTLFVCKGAHFRPQYLAEALARGAFVYLSEQPYPEQAGGAPVILVSEIRRAMALIADLYYNQVWRRLTTVGITGTKGKSSTTYYVRAILDAWEKAQGRPRTAVISGIDNYDGVSCEESHLTTPEAMMLHRHFDNAVRSGIEYLTMEVSSQALKYHRTLGITFDVGCFLNLGEDHVSPVEHPTIEDYMNSKMVLMHQCRTAVINRDSRYADWALREARQSAEQVLTFGRSEEADVRGYAVQPRADGIDFRARGAGFDEPFAIGMTGLFNVSNALAAITITRALGVPLATIREGLAAARVSGRMEVFSDPRSGRVVIVDYAHNKMSFEALFDSVREEYPGRRIRIVFGCPGRKAQRRRRELGEAAGASCDKVYLTEEDAGEEPVLDICREIEPWVTGRGCACEIIPDRGEAIHRAIEEADADTVLLLTGKGRETRQKRGLQYIDTPSDVAYVERWLGGQGDADESPAADAQNTGTAE